MRKLAIAASVLILGACTAEPPRYALGYGEPEQVNCEQLEWHIERLTTAVSNNPRKTLTDRLERYRNLRDSKCAGELAVPPAMS